MMSSASAVASTSSTARADDAPVGVDRDLGGQTGPRERGCRERMEPVGVERDPRHRARAGTGARRGRATGARSTSRPAARRTPSASRSRGCRCRRSRRCGPRSSGIRSGDGGRPGGRRARTTGCRGQRPGRPSPARSRAPRSAARCSAVISFRRNEREKPPTRTDTGWMARPPISATSWLPAFLRASPDSTAARWSTASSSALA